MTLSVVEDLIEIGGLGEFSATELTKALAGKKVSISPFVGTTEEGYNASSTPKDLETLFQLGYLYFTSLRSDDEGIHFLENQERSRFGQCRKPAYVGFQ